MCLPCKWNRPMSSCLERTGPWGSPDTSTRRSHQFSRRTCLPGNQSMLMNRSRQKIFLAHRMSRCPLMSRLVSHFLCPHHTEHRSFPSEPTESQTIYQRYTTCRLGPLLHCRCLHHRADKRTEPWIHRWKSTCRKCTTPSMMSRTLILRISL
jgi:hypothetical protein